MQYKPKFGTVVNAVQFIFFKKNNLTKATKGRQTVALKVKTCLSRAKFQP